MTGITRKYIEARLAALGVDPTLINRYDEPQRFYHTLDHVIEILEYFKRYGALDNDVLFLSAVFHDIIYNPKALDNELKSKRLFKEVFSGPKEVKEEVELIIADTQTHETTSPLSAVFQKADIAVFDKPFEGLLDYENKIFKEFQYADWKLYRPERIRVLQQFNIDGKLNNLISYVANRKPSIGVYAGSFNPFHKGHYNILQKAEQIFDKVIIAFGKNLEKNNAKWPVPQTISFRQIEEYDGLITDFVKSLGYDVTLIRGLRNTEDLKYEMKQYRYMQDFMPEVKVVSLFSDPQFEHISSSSIRILEKYGKHQNYLLE